MKCEILQKCHESSEVQKIFRFCFPNSGVLSNCFKSATVLINGGKLYLAKLPLIYGMKINFIKCFLRKLESSEVDDF